MCGLDTGSDISQMASVLADATRAKVCVALMDGCAWTAGELARHTQTSPQAMSSCLMRLEDAQIISRIRQGRHQYVQLSDERTAKVIEFLGSMVEPRQEKPIGYRQVRADQRLRYARSCYNHIAGHLGVDIAQSMQGQHLINIEDGSIRLTDDGLHWFAHKGIALPESRTAPRIKACLDWTERHFHIGGSAGSALLSYLLDHQLIVKATPKRALHVTEKGTQWFADELNLQIVNPTSKQ
jgi:DNA-binding transcriptional ArsR family regulator